MRFFRKKNQPGGGPPGGSPSDREIPRPPFEPLPPIPARRRAAGAGCFYACEGRLHDGFTMDPAAAAEWQNAFFLFWMQKTLGSGDRRGSGREIPHAGKARPTRLQRFCKRNRGAGLYARVCGAHRGHLIRPNYNGSGAGSQGRNRFFPVPDAESAEVRRPPFPRPGNSPCHRNAPAAPAEA